MTDFQPDNVKPVPTKLFGSYPQKQSDLFMQRIPVFASDIEAGKLTELAKLAIDYTSSTPLHLTTRQNIELHNVPKVSQQKVHDIIAKLGFKTFGAGGDSLRNITVCPCCKYNPSAIDPTPIAIAAREVLKTSGLLDKMSRKFKLSFAGCGSPQSKPYLTELGIIASSRETVKVIGAGSLGARPSPGIVLFDSVAVGHVPALALAALRLFVDHGDKTNRRKARLRHIRERLGDSEFKLLLNKYFETAKDDVGIVDIKLSNGIEGYSYCETLQTIAGDIPPADILVLTEALENQQARIIINLNQGINIYSKEKFIIPEPLEKYFDRPVIISCPGNTTCPNGIINAPRLAKELSQKLSGKDKFSDKIIAISGCPNNCMHSCVSNIGLIGRVKSISGKRHEACMITTGGDNAITDKLAENREVVITSEISKWLEDNEL